MGSNDWRDIIAKWLGSVWTLAALPVLWIVLESILGEPIRQHRWIAVGVVAILVGAWAILRWFSRRPPSPPIGDPSDSLLQDAARHLAHILNAQWRPEAQKLRLIHKDNVDQDTSLLIPIRWECQDGNRPDVQTTKRFPTSGSVDELVDMFTTIRTHQLVILGDEASGKSVAALLLTLGLLEQPGDRGPDNPVPVLLSLNSWNPKKITLAAWIREKIVEVDRGLASEADFGQDMPSRLLDEGFVLPVLDGMNELAKTARLKLIGELDRMPSLPGFVLTCWPTEFREAEERGRWLVDATPVVLNKLTAEQVKDYLCAAEIPARRARWQRVFDEIDMEPAGPLGRVLSSPLMVKLAHEVYKDATQSDPEQLLVDFQTAADAEIKQHLLTGFVPAAFSDHAAEGGTWQPGDAENWLSSLAAEMSSAGHREIRWWELSVYARTPTRILAGLLTTVLAAASWGTAVGMALWVLVGPTAGLVAGALVAAAFGIAGAIHPPPEPLQIQFRQRGRLQSALGGGLPTGLIATAIGVIIWSPVAGLWAGLAFGLPVGVFRGYTHSAPSGHAVSPRSLLERDIKAGIVYGLVYGMPAAIIGTLVSGSLLIGLPFGFAFLLAGSLMHGPFWKSGKEIGAVGFVHLALATLWFARRKHRKLPWNVIGFLDDAHHLGVLRQDAGVYKFRHDNLQRALARAAMGT